MLTVHRERIPKRQDYAQQTVGRTSEPTPACPMQCHAITQVSQGFEEDLGFRMQDTQVLQEQR